jgi:hypothetical protein
VTHKEILILIEELLVNNYEKDLKYTKTELEGLLNEVCHIIDVGRKQHAR